MIYIDPSDIWEKFQENKTSLEGHYLTCAEDDDIKIFMTVESGDLVLAAEDYTSGDSQYETIESEDEAIEVYSTMLTWIACTGEALDDDDVPDDPDSDMEPILAAAYAFIGVLAGKPPDKLGLDKDDLEDAAYQMAWYLKGRYRLDSMLA